MADSYPTADVGAVADFPRFPLEPNWISEPATDIVMLRKVIQFRGTSHHIVPLTDDAPINLELKFTIFTTADYSSLMDHFVTARGRCNRFWVKHHLRTFELKTTASSGSSQLICYPNNFHLQYQGHERIYIEMSDGDILARHLTAANYNESSDQLELSINTSLDRDVTTTNHVIIGRYLLVRFDSDNMRLEAVTDQVCELSLSFTELVREYDEI